MPRPPSKTVFAGMLCLPARAVSRKSRGAFDAPKGSERAPYLPLEIWTAGAGPEMSYDTE